MIRILLACEGGTGLGHVGNLRSIAEALGSAFSFDGCYYLEQPLEVLEPVCDAVFRCPGMIVRKRPKPDWADERNWSWANFLASCALDRPDVLAQAMLWWRSVIISRKIDLVVSDYAPRAMLAARTLGVPVAVTGTSYSVPPDGLAHFPALMSRDAATFADEERLMASINAVCTIRGMEPLRHLPDMYDCAVKLPRGLNSLDPYEGIRTEPLLPRPSTYGREMAGSGNEIFVYLSHIAADPSFMLDALTELGAPVRAYIPWLDAERTAGLRAKGILVEDNPLESDDIARRSRLMVLYGQPATMTLGLAAGLPQMAFPQHFEQLFHAERASRTGAVRYVTRDSLTRESFVTTIREAYGDSGMLAAARRIAPAVRAEMTVDVPDMIRESLRPALVGIIRKKGLA